tara:strand:+ start:11981 stop:12640 length:660 start_codon:yes stop_codon:yes gene_type:complete
MINKGYSIHSQFGEDGILQYLIETLNLTNKQSCEFGMSGIIFSNTFNLVENYNWFGVYIERNNIELPKNLNIHLFNKEVEASGLNSLDNILKETKLDKCFDILSIDIDNKDYHIWNSLEDYEPNIVIIEINPFLNFDEEYINDGTKFSSSFKSTVNLATKKGYSLVCMSGNLIFVKRELLAGTELEKYITSNPNDLFLNDAIMVTDRQISFKRFRAKII